MGYIAIYNINFPVPPTVIQTARIEYRKITSPLTDTIHLWTDSATILLNGYFDPTVYITGLDDNSWYEVYITLDCGGTYVTQQYYTIGSPTTTTSTTAFQPCNSITNIEGEAFNDDSLTTTTTHSPTTTTTTTHPVSTTTTTQNTTTTTSPVTTTTTAPVTTTTSTSNLTTTTTAAPATYDLSYNATVANNGSCEECDIFPINFYLVDNNTYDGSNPLVMLDYNGGSGVINNINPSIVDIAGGAFYGINEGPTCSNVTMTVVITDITTSTEVFSHSETNIVYNVNDTISFPNGVYTWQRGHQYHIETTFIVNPCDGTTTTTTIPITTTTTTNGVLTTTTTTICPDIIAVNGTGYSEGALT